MATNLWEYRERLSRIIEESLEVALVICNGELGEFTLGKIFDIFNQILATGFIVNTGYWPFFNSLKKQSICVCGRYGFDCRHFKQGHHWIDLELIPADTTFMFSTSLGTLLLVNSEIDLIPMTVGSVGYTVNMKLTFQYGKIERGRSCRRSPDENFIINPNQLIHVAITGRYILRREYYPAIHTIMFQPSPFSYQSYGSYFPKLLQYRQALSKDFNYQFYTVPIEKMPHFTLVLIETNMPLHKYCNLVRAHTTRLDTFKPKLPMYNKETQTEIQNENEIWKYKEIIGNLKPIWNDVLRQPPTPAQNIFSPSRVLGPFPMSPAIPNIPPPSYSSVTKQQPKQMMSLPLQQDLQLSNQWANQQFVAKKRGRKKQSTYGDTASSSSIAVRQKPNGTLHWSNGKCVPSYAAALKAPKLPSIVPPYSVANRLAKIQAKDDSEFEWLENQFPDLVKPIQVKTETIDDELELAEEFIRQELHTDPLNWPTL